MHRTVSSEARGTPRYLMPAPRDLAATMAYGDGSRAACDGADPDFVWSLYRTSSPALTSSAASSHSNLMYSVSGSDTTLSLRRTRPPSW